MTELIDRLETIQRIKNLFCSECECEVCGCRVCEYDFCIGVLNEMPTIEPEVRCAYWEPNEIGEYYCTNCGVGCDIDQFHKPILNCYCGNCGARMNEIANYC